MSSTTPRVRFGAFVFDRETRQLRRDEAPLRLKPQAFDLLDLLIARRPAAVSKQEIRDRLWPDTFVSESTLSSLVAQARRALGRDGARAVRTVHGFGYAFAAEACDERTAAGPRSIQAHLFWNRRTLPLVEGENVIGRDESCEARVEAAGVSRRHARVVAQDGRFTLEDLGSKNGTHLRGARLVSPVPLQDGDEFRLGQTPVVFRIRGEVPPTATDR